MRSEGAQLLSQFTHLKNRVKIELGRNDFKAAQTTMATMREVYDKQSEERKQSVGSLLTAADTAVTEYQESHR